jgi:4-hydroxy-tetrahydrodipicolinate synthase
MLDETAKGVFTIAVTPFLPDGALDLPSIDRMVDFYEEKGATGLTILGMMGEAGKLSAEESVEVVTRVTARASVPVVVGVSAPGLAAIGALAKTAMDKGAAGVMVAPQGGLKSDDQILGYFANVAETLGRYPLGPAGFPARDRRGNVALRLPEDLRTPPDLRDAETRGLAGLEKISTLRRAEADGARRVSILCGNGAQFLLEEMIRGADGAMTGFAYPEMMADVVRLMTAGEEDKGPRPLRRLHAAHPLRGAAGPRPRDPQAHARRRGAIAHATARKPSPQLSAAAIAEIDTLIARQEARLATLA